MVRGDSYGKSSIYIVSSTIYGKREYEEKERDLFIKIIMIMIANEVCQSVHHLKQNNYTRVHVHVGSFPQM